MITVIAKNYIKNDKIEDTLEICKELIEETRKEEGCIKYELHQDIENQNILTMIEEWEKQENLNAHLKSEHFSRLAPKFAELIEKETEMNIYTKSL